MDEKVRLWAKTLLTAYPYLEEAANAVEARIKSSAVNSWSSPLSAEALCGKILHLISVKEGLINAKVVTDECLSGLPSKVYKALKCRYIFRLSFTMMSGIADVSERSVYKHIQRAEDSFTAALIMKGYDLKRLEELFGDNTFLKGVYNKLT